MRMPRVTIRRAMLLVVIIAMALAVVARRSRFLELSEYHRAHAGTPTAITESSRTYFAVEHADGTRDFISSRRHWWHVSLQEKYERAARYPWLPVEPDASGPE